MLTPSGPKVIEYNCRFGDPETQVVLPLLKSDLLDIFQAVRAGRLSEIQVEFSDQSACCVVLASKGYPGKYETGYPITQGQLPSGAKVYVCRRRRSRKASFTPAAAESWASPQTAGTLAQATQGAYACAQQIQFENRYCRSDIGARALQAEGTV